MQNVFIIRCLEILMRKILILLILVLLFAFNVGAAEISPESLSFEMHVNEEKCGMITITNLTDEVEVSNIWQEENNLDVIWDITNSDDDKEIEVCISGEEIGEYHGAIIFRQEQQGSPVVNLSTEMFVKINEIQTSQETPQVEQKNSGGGGGSSRKVTPKNSTNSTTKSENLSYENQFENLTAEKIEESSGSITGNVVNEKSGKYSVALKLIPVLIIGLLIGARIYVGKKRKNNFEMKVDNS